MKVEWDGKVRDLNDGLGLCSPLRAHPSCRLAMLSEEAGSFSSKLASIIDAFVTEVFPDQAKAVIALALGKFQKQPFTDDRMEKLRRDWFKLLPDPAAAAKVPTRQPFLLHALSQSAKIMGDPDWQILDQGDFCFAKGVRLGVGCALPRTPAVFKLKTRRRKYDESMFKADMANYQSAETAGPALRKQFLEE